MTNGFEVDTKVLLEDPISWEEYEKNIDLYLAPTEHENENIKAKVKKLALYNQKEALSLGVQGVTTFFFNGKKMLGGFYDLDILWSDILKMIEEFLRTNNIATNDHYLIRFIIEPKENSTVYFTIEDVSNDDGSLIVEKIQLSKEYFLETMIEEATKVFTFLKSLQLEDILYNKYPLSLLNEINMLMKRH